MDKKKILLIIFILVVLFAGPWFLTRYSNQSPAVIFDQQATYYFYGDTCSHCHDLDVYLKKQKLDNKNLYQKLEVFEHSENSALLTEAAKACQISESTVGVPFIYSKGKCYLGIDEAMNFFKQYR